MCILAEMLQVGSVVCGRTAVGKLNYSMLSWDEHDFDRGEHLGLSLDTNRSFLANVACTDARFL